MKIMNFKYLIMCLMALVVSCSKEKSDYIVSVKLPEGVKTDSLHILNFKGDKIASAAAGTDGVYKFTGKVAEAAPAGIESEKLQLYIPFILENADISIDIKDKQKNTDIKGGQIHEIIYGYMKDPEFQRLDRELKEVTKKQFTNLDMNDEAKVEEARKIVSKTGDKVFKIKNEYLKKVVADKNPVMAKAIAATMISERDYTADKILARLAEYKKEVDKSEFIDYYEKMMQEFQTMADNAKNVTVGSTFQDVVARDRDGREIKLSDLVAKNKYTILEFWASWCGPCRGEIPNLKKAYAKYHGKGLEIYSVSLDQKESSWLKALDDEKTAWPNVLVEGEFTNPQVVNYGITGIPASYLIDQNGTIVALNDELREFQLDRTLSAHLK